MQVTSLAKTDDGENEKIAAIVADKYCRIILKHIVNHSMSATELSQKTKIPISTIYRKVHAMCNLRLLKTFGEINDDGKKYYYQSKVTQISIFYQDGILQVKVTANDFHI